MSIRPPNIDGSGPTALGCTLVGGIAIFFLGWVFFLVWALYNLVQIGWKLVA